MESKKIWYFLSLLFLIYNLCLLCEESSNYNYKFLNETDNQTYLLRYAICIRINELNENYRFKKFQNQTIEYSETFFNVSNFLKQTVELLNNELIDETNGTNQIFELQTSYVFNKYGCYRMNYKDLRIINVFSKFNYRLFSYTDHRRWFFNIFTYENVAPENVLVSLSFYKLTIEYDKPDNVDLEKFECLNECLKNINRKSIYLYEWYDIEPINLNDNQATESYENQTTNEKKYCYQKCDLRSPIMLYLLVVSQTQIYSVDKTIYANSSVINVHFKTYPSYSTSEFLLQFIGLITLFINININDTLPALFKMVFKNYFDEVLFSKIYPKTKFALLVISLIVVKDITYSMVTEYYKELNNPIETKISNYSISPVPFSLVICVPIKYLIFGQQETAISTGMNDSEILAKYSYEKIENYTNSGLKQIIDQLFISYGNKRKTIDDYKISDKIFFRNCTYYSDYNHEYGKKSVHLFSRCFQIDLAIKENKYQSLLTISNLVLKRKNTLNNVYLLEEKEPFSSTAFYFKGDFKILLKRSRKSTFSKKANCTFYRRYRSTMIDECINQKFIEKYQNLTTSALLYKGQFKSYIFQMKYFNDTVDHEIVEQCNEQYKSRDCNLSVFRNSFSRISEPDKRLEQNLYFEIIEYNDSKVYFWNLPLNILNLVSIFFGLNAIKLLMTFFFVIIHLILRLKWYKIFRHLISAICFIALIMLIRTIFEEVINGGLIQNAYYKKNDTIGFPDINLCFKIFDNELEEKLKMDPNHKLTGRNLFKASVQLEDKIEKLSYMTKNGTFKDFDPFKDENDLFEIKYFIYNNIKCIEISSNLVYKEEDLHFVDDPYLLKIYLKHQTTSPFLSKSYFLTKKKKSKQFNQVHKVDLGCLFGKLSRTNF